MAGRNRMAECFRYPAPLKNSNLEKKIVTIDVWKS